MWHGCGSQLDDEVLEEWEHRLGRMMKVGKPPEVNLKGRFHFEPPLRAHFWDAWQKFSKDPERETWRLGLEMEHPWAWVR